MKWLVLKQTIKSKLSLFIIGIILSSNAMAVSLFTIKTSEFFQWHSEQNVRGYSQSFDEKILQGYIKDLKEKTVNILEDASKVDTLVLFSEVLNDSGLNLCFCMNINPKFKLIDE